MTVFRWLILRLFWSLLLLPPLAFAILWVLHTFVFKEVYLQDSLLVLILWVIILPVVSIAITHEGRRRFNFLHERGRMYIKSEREDLVREAFTLILQLFASGMLSRRIQQTLKRNMLRSYFPFYAEHPESDHFREQLLEAMRTGVRPDEAYHVLKSHVLNQAGLSLELADLAEELLDHRPEDEALATFFVRHFLKEKKTHYRAEYFYMRHLAADGPLVKDILALCMEKVLKRNRKDDFSGWCYVRAIHGDWQNDARVRKALKALYEEFQLLQRKDALAQAVSGCISLLTPAEIEEWSVQREEAEHKSLKALIERWLYSIQQFSLDLITKIREQRVWVASGAAGLLLILLIYLILPIRTTSEEQPAAQQVVQEDSRRYFSVQVGALRNKRSAEQAVKTLEDLGLFVYVLEPQKPRGWYRIRVGKYETRQEARFAADSLKASGIIQDYFVANYEKQ